MDSWVEFEGKNVGAALKKAGEKLNLPLEKVEHEIVFAGSSGIFGLVGAKNARIRVVDPNHKTTSSEEALQDDKEMIQSLMEEAFSDKITVPKKEKTPQPAAAAILDKDSDVEASLSKKDSGGGAALSPPTDFEEDISSLDESSLHTGKEVLQKIADLITTEATASMELQKNRVFFRVEGGNAAVLIGKRGQTLKAMQHIAEKVVRKATASKVGVQVDVEQYMEKREASLKELALRLAEKTKQTGKASTISRVDSFERKIIHGALRQEKAVKTRSVGSGDLRNVVIHPGKKGQGQPRKAPA